jgi:hypothetical protein
VKVGKRELIRVFLQRCAVAALILLPPSLCLQYALTTSGSTRILLSTLVEAFISGSALVFSIHLVPYPAARDPKAVRELT